MAENQPQPTPMSEDTKSIITVILLVFIYPIGLIMMWVWTNWKNSVKWIVTLIGCLPFVLFILAFLFMIIFAPGIPSEPNQPPYTFEDGEQCTLIARVCEDGSSAEPGPKCAQICPEDIQ